MRVVMESAQCAKNARASIFGPSFGLFPFSPMLSSLTRRLAIPVQSAETLVFSCDRTRFFKFVSAVVVSQAAFFAIASWISSSVVATPLYSVS